jgi:hypothetical protein
MTRNDESRTAFQKELEAIINRTSQENGSDTPDFILAEYLRDCLDSFDKAVARRAQWFAPALRVCSRPPEPTEPVRTLDCVGTEGGKATVEVFKPTKNQPYPPAFHVSETARFGNVV